ncbi:MAG: LysE family translocator [Leptonema sp. (in: bacteria)]
MLKFFLIGFLGVFLPGPDMLLILRISLSSKIQNAFLTLFGILTGNFVYVIPVFFGISIYLKKFINYFLILGSLYLIYIGFSSLRIREQTFFKQLNVPNHYTNPYLLGLFTNLSNPKAMLYFASVLLPAFQMESSLFLLVSFFLGVISAFVSLIFIGVSISNWIESHLLYKIQIIFSILFIGYGITLFINGLNFFFK